MTRLSSLLLVFGLFLVLAAPWALAFDAADVNHDGAVDATDARIFFQAWKDFRGGTPVASLPAPEPNADINADAKIDHVDFRLFLDSWLGAFKPSINPADYLTYTNGDKRYWADSGGIFHWRDSVETVIGPGSLVMDRHIPITPAGEVTDVWPAGGPPLIAEGIGVDGVAYTYTTPMTLPAKLVQGVPVVLSSDLSPSGHIDMTLTLLDVNKTVTMVGAAHTWTATCAKVEIVKDGTVGGAAYHDDRIEWLAPGMGPVEEDTNPASPGTQIMTLQYLKIGATTYGTLPTATTAGLYPMAKGNMHIFQGADQVFGNKILDPKVIGTQSLGVQADFTLPDGDVAQYFTVSGGSAAGLAGFRLAHDVSDYAFVTTVDFGTTFTFGNAIAVTNGVIAYNGNPSWGTFSAVVCPVGMEQTVSAAGTSFPHCVVLDIHESATKNGQTSPFQQNDSRVWLAPNVGPVQVASLDTTATPSSVRTAEAGVSGVSPAIYIVSGSSTYGTQPTLDWWAAMHMATNNAWGLARGAGSDPHLLAVEAPETLGTVTGAMPLTETWPAGGLGYPNVGFIQSDYWLLKSSSVRFAGHRNDPDDQGYPLTFVPAAPMGFPQTLTMGDSFASLLTTVNDVSTGLPVVINGTTVQMRITVALVSAGTSHNSILGTDFTGCSVVEKYMEIPALNYWELVTYVYDASAGVVEYHKTKAGKIGSSDFWLKWARVGANTWGGAGSHDPADTLPLATGNDWRLGPTTPSVDYQTWTVGASESGNGYTGILPVTKQQNTDSQPDLDRYVTDATHRLWVGADYYTSTNMGPYPAWLTPAFSMPRPWPIGQVVRANMTATVGAPVNQNFQYLAVRVPVDFGLTVTTPAGTFDDCVAVAELLQFAPVGTTTSWTWKHLYQVYAPGVGPVEFWVRKGVQGGTIADSYAKFGLLQYADVGGVHYPH